MTVDPYETPPPKRGVLVSYVRCHDCDNLEEEELLRVCLECGREGLCEGCFNNHETKHQDALWPNG